MNIPLTKILIADGHAEEVKKVLKSGWVTYGKVTEDFEKAVAEYTGAKYAVAVSSGTAALHLAFIVSGIQAGDEVLCPSFSFIASANAIRYCGAMPIFVDIKQETWNINENLIAQNITSRTKAILAVHQFGTPCNMEKINEIAEKYNLIVIEDAACALGSEYKGEKIGNGKNLGCLSFHPRKIITTGEGGMLVTNDEGLFKLAKALSLHGTLLNKKSGVYSIGPSFTHVGYNYKLTDMAAALGLAQLKELDKIVEERNTIAKKYNASFGNIPEINILSIESGAKTNYQSYNIEIKSCSEEKRDEIIRVLNEKGIGARASISPIHVQEAYKDIHSKNVLSVTEESSRSSLLLPLYQEMTDGEIEYVAENTIKAVKAVMGKTTCSL